MPLDTGPSALLLASAREFPDSELVWGTGGWIEPLDREGLDWLTLLRISGWGAEIRRSSGDDRPWPIGSGCRWLIVADDPAMLDENFIERIEALLHQHPVLVVARPAPAGHRFARLSGASCPVEPPENEPLVRSIDWVGPGERRTWHCRDGFRVDSLNLEADARVWASSSGRCLISARSVGRGTVATLAFHPSKARDSDGMATRLLRHLLIAGSGGPVAWFDFDNTMVLRMDDPGGAQNVFLGDWCYSKLDRAAWSAIGNSLRRHKARLSVAYVTGWVDDGNASRGELTVDGAAVRRVPGRVYPTPRVIYRDRNGHAPGALSDYVAEYGGLRALITDGLASIQLHGHTHIHPDTNAWLTAADRYTSNRWFRELGPAASASIAERPAGHHPLDLGIAAIQQWFGTRSSTLVCPGEQWTLPVLKHALDLGLRQIGSYYLALRYRDRLCWAMHVCAPYLDESDSRWFDSGLPVVGYFHDREPALEGVGWLDTQLDRWRSAGAARMIDYEELASALGLTLSIEEIDGSLQMNIAVEAGTPEIIRPLPVCVYSPGNTRHDRVVCIRAGAAASMLSISEAPGPHAYATIRLQPPSSASM